MLELKQTTDADVVERYCATLGVLYHETCGACVATDHRGEAGFCVYSAADGELMLHGASVRDKDIALCDGLVRASLAHAYSAGIGRAQFDSGFAKELRNGLRSFGHIDETVPDIDNFLSNCKNCSC